MRLGKDGMVYVDGTPHLPECALSSAFGIRMVSGCTCGSIPKTKRIDPANAAVLGRAVFKRCPCCGREHDRESWSRLRLVGRQDDLELRNCVCLSTIAVPLEAT